MPTFKRRDQEADRKGQGPARRRAVAEMGFVKSLFFGRLKLDGDAVPEAGPRRGRAAPRADRRTSTPSSRAKSTPDRIDAEERIPQRVIDGLGKLGVLGMTVPKEYGGGGFSTPAYCRVLERVAPHCASTAVAGRGPPVDRPQGPGADGHRAAEARSCLTWRAAKSSRRSA